MINVLIIDDSALVRSVLTAIIDSAPGLNVVGTAADPFVAREKIKKLNPDVLTLDVEMPRMDGVTFLSNLMRLRPMPVVMISSLTEQGADVTLNALELGAVDFITKPKIDVRSGLEDYTAEIVEKLKVAASAKVTAINPRKIASKVNSRTTEPVDSVNKHKVAISNYETTDKIIAIGSSTGGTEAVKEVLVSLPPECPGIVISQHIPAGFSESFAKRLNTLTELNCYEAKNGQQILPGHVYVSPGDKHLRVKKSGARYLIELDDGPEVNRHRPSVEVMFRSVAMNVGKNAIGIMLTGMGNDGAVGMKEMKDAGAVNLVQDEETSVVWGMPGEAVKIGAHSKILPLGKIAGNILHILSK
jgi:two-component system, chemotaxis family, protein-glutamate methylesterase/glutaminase